jgi:hypothetical protein
MQGRRDKPFLEKLAFTEEAGLNQGGTCKIKQSKKTVRGFSPDFLVGWFGSSKDLFQWPTAFSYVYSPSEELYTDLQLQGCM